MLGARIEKARAAIRRSSDAAAGRATVRPRLGVRNLRVGTKLEDVSFDLDNGEVAGVVALEGQGQDELFGALSGSIRPSGGTIEVDGQPVQFGHPADAIRAGIAYVPGDRTEALLMQRSVRENIALPFSAALAQLGSDRHAPRARKVVGAIERLQIDTRAQREVQRLSGGNQQKVTIARWIAAGRAHHPVLRPDARHRRPHQARDLPAAARARRTGQVGAVLHVRARGGAAGLRPRHRHLRRPRGRRAAGRDRRRSGADARRLRPAARRAGQDVGILAEVLPGDAAGAP